MAFGSSGGSDDIEIKITTDSSQAERGFSRLQASIVTFNQALALLERGWRGIDKLMSRADNIQDISQAFESLQASVGQKAAPAIAKLQKEVGGLVGKLDLMKAANRAVMMGVDDGTGRFADMAGEVVKLGKAMGIDGARAVDLLTKSIASQREMGLKLLGVDVDLQAATKDLKTEEAKREATIKAVSAALDDQVKLLAGGPDSLPDAWNQLKIALSDFADTAIQDLSGPGGAAEAIIAVADAIKYLNANYKDFLAVGETSKFGWSTIKGGIGGFLQGGMAGFLKGLEGGALDYLAGGVGDAIGNLLVKGTETPQFRTKIKRTAQKTAEELNKELKEQAESLRADYLWNIEFDDAVAQLEKEENSIGKQIQNALGISDENADMWYQVGQTIADGISQGIQDGFKGNSGDILSSIANISTQSGAAIANAYLPGSGPIYASIMGPIEQAMAGWWDHVLFGGGNAGTEARKAVDKWFADALDPARLELVIRGQLTKINDLIFAGNFEGPVGEGFMGLGNALAEMLHETGISAQQLASVLTANLGGSLNDLQIMINALNLSLEDLQSTLENAFLVGDLSAKEYLASLAEVNDVMTQGIPGAVGAVDEAFNNLIEGGLQNGRIAMDAFGDLAAEAIERGATSLEDLKNQLIASGVPLEDVNKLMQAFADQGITSLEQLKEIGPEATAKLISELEDLGLAFEPAIESANELADTLEMIRNTDWSTQVDVYYVEHDKPSELGGGGVARTYGGSGISGGVANVATGNSGYWTPTRSFASRGALAMASVMGPRRSYNLNRIVGRLGDSSSSVLNSALSTAMGMGGGDITQNFRQVASLMARIELLQGAINTRFEEGGKFPEKMVQSLIKLNAQLDAMGQKALTPEQQIAQVTEAVLAGKMDLATAAAIIAANKAQSGGGLPGFGDITGAASALFAGGSSANQMADWKNLMTEAQEGGYGSSEFANILREKFGSKADTLIQFLSGKGLNTLDAMLNIDDSALVELLAAAEKGLVIPVSFATPDQAPGQGGGRRTRVNSQGITQVFSKRKNKWVPARHQPL